MDLKEAITHLRGETKPYIGKMPQSTYFNTIRNIEAGLAKESTIISFFEKLGYEVKSWIEINKK